MSEDKINPSHYKWTKVECIDLAESFSFCAGNVLKYVYRAGRKSGNSAITDLQKAMWYLDREIKRVKDLEESS